MANGNTELEPPAPGTTPSVGAAITSLHHVLDVTDGILTPELRQHLQGIALYLHRQENEEIRVYTEQLTGTGS